jgi:hypothetical protein
MQSDRPEVPRRIVRNAPHRVNLICESLEAAGFSIADGNIEELDSRVIMIECLLAPELRDGLTGDNPHYEKIMSYQVERAKHTLRQFSGVKVESYGWRLVIWLQTPEKDVNFKTSPGRRFGTKTTKKAVADAKKLRAEGCTFQQIDDKLGDEHGHRAPDSWRKLVDRDSLPSK